jgi:succinoglycan biosynthesis transport protein ExoP
VQESQPTIDYLAVLRRRIHWFVWPTLVIFFGAAAVAILLPNVYKSEATILIESRQISEGLVASTVTSYADQRIESIKQEVMSRSKILDLVKKFDLYPEQREKISTDALVEKVKKSIAVQPLSAAVQTGRSDRPAYVTIAFTVSFDGKDPSKVQGVVNDLTSFFLTKNLDARKASARGTTDFLEKQVEKVKETLDEVDKKIADFKETHLEELPEFMALNLRKVETTNDRINNIDREILALKEQTVIIKQRLASVDPYSVTGGAVLSDEERLQQLQLNYTQLKSKYSESHPDVKVLEKEIEILGNTVGRSQDSNQKRNRLSQLQQELAQLQSRYSEQHPVILRIKAEINEIEKELEVGESSGDKIPETARVDIQNATNPAYLNLQSELDRINLRSASLRNEKKELTEEEDKIYTKLRTMPDVEKQYKDLLTDRDSLNRNLNELQQKLQVAVVAQGMEEGQLGENFTITEPAFLPEEPYKPNRKAIMLFGLILALGASVGTAALREYTDHSVHIPEEIERLTGQSVLAIIPSIQTPLERRKKLVKRISAAFLIIAVPFAGLAVFHYLVMDLYIFYDKLSKLLSDRLFVHF